MRFVPAWLLAAAALCGAAPALHAQIVTGHLVSAEDGQPVAGGFVLLLDSAGRRQGAAITDAAGRFTLRAATAGRYTLRAERIGFESVESPGLVLTAGTLSYRFAVPARAVQLSSVEVTSSGRGCERRPDAPAVYALWNEVRKALSIASWTQARRNTQFSLFAYTRELDPTLGTLRSESRHAFRSGALAPFSAMPVEQLVSDGFMRRDGDDWELYGPDADVLISDAFLDSHCFHIEPGADPTLVGLAFAPLNRRGPPDISGVLWVDRRTSELRHITYGYVNVPADAGEGAAGRVEYARLDDGTWIVQRWWIRGAMLRHREVVDRSGRREWRTEGVGVREEGGAVVSAAVPGVAPRSFDGPGVIEGVVVDSLDAGARAGVLVFVSGHPQESLIDEQGRFRLEGVPAGRHGVALQHPFLAELQLPVPLDSVDVRPDAPARVALTVPSMTSLLNTICPGQIDEQAPAMQGLLWGAVIDGESGEPIPDIEVRAAWRGPGRMGGTDHERHRTARTAADGRFFLCWMPETREITVHRRDGRQWVDEQGVMLDAARPPILRHEFITGTRDG